MGPLEGLRVLDMTSVVMGPYTTQFLGDFGADVIKVEAPAGDVVRQVGPSRNSGMGPLFLNSNRSKRSITLDLKTPEGLKALLRLAERADVLVYNIRPAAMARLGLSYEEVSAHNPRIIYAGMFGYSQDGPYAAYPAYDDLIQGAAALPYLFQRAGSAEPHYVPTAISDRVVGLFALSAILAGIHERGSSGQGQRIDIPMFECMASFILSDHLGGQSYDPPLDRGGYHRQLSPERRPYQTSDGYICALLYTDAHWRRFFMAIERSDLIENDHRFATFNARMEHLDEVYKTLSDLLSQRTTAEWLEIFGQADIPAMPMNDIEGILNDPHMQATDFFQFTDHPSEGRLREMKVPTQFYRTPATPSQPVPRQGQDGRQILSEAGFSTEELQELADTGGWLEPDETIEA